ncbi:MAG: hypothetical protein ACOC85_02965 [Thermoplasmatota archaeon]
MNQLLYIVGIIGWIIWMGIFAWLAANKIKGVGKTEKVEHK